MTKGGLKFKKLNRLVLGCIEAKFCKKILVGKLSPRSTQCTPLHRFGIESPKPGKTWKEKSLAKTTSGRDDQKKPVAAASYSILQRDEWLRRKKPRGKKFQSNSVVFCCCCAVSVAYDAGKGSQPT